MTTELYWLTLSIFLSAILWLPYIINRLVEQGIFKALWDPDGDTATVIPWARRLMSAHVNSVENLVVFAPLVIVADITGTTTELTVTASILYFFSRLAHVVLFTLRTPVFRIVAFFMSFVAQMIFILSLLQVV